MHLHLLSPVRSFLHEHDESAFFHAAYVVVTICAALLWSAGVYAMLMLVHMVFDVVKYRTKERLSWTHTIFATLRESLVDFALLTLCLTFAVYLHHSVELIAMMSGLLHAEVSVMRAASCVIPKMFIGKRLLDVVFKGHPQFLAKKHHLASAGILEWTCLGSLAFMLFLLIVAPSLIGVSATTETEILLEHLSLFRV